MTPIVISLMLTGFFLGSPAIASGIILGTMIIAGLSILYMPLPISAKRVIVFFRWPIDLSLSTGICIALGATTATALVGAVTAGLLMTLLLSYENQKLSGISSDKRDIIMAINQCNLDIKERTS